MLVMMANIYLEGYLEVPRWLTFWSADTKTREMLYKREGKKGCVHFVAVLSNWTFHSIVRFWFGRWYWEGWQMVDLIDVSGFPQGKVPVGLWLKRRSK